ncbi:MAG TPA: DinB family protein [Candidatus Acidoferrum sp.]
MTPHEMQLLYTFNDWANKRSMEAASALTPEQFTKPLGNSFPSVRDTLAHIAGAESVWLQRFKGSSPSAMPDNSQFADIASLQAHWTPAAADLLNFISGLSQQDLDRVIEYKTMNFGTYSNPMWQSLQHVANHGTYHRGQVTTMLRQLGAKPILTDLMHFYRERGLSASA